MTDPDAFRRDVRRELAPRGPLESLVADAAVEAAWRLRDNLDREAVHAAVPALAALGDALDVFADVRARRPAGPDPTVVAYDPRFDGDASDWSELPGWIEEPDAR